MFYVKYCQVSKKRIYFHLCLFLYFVSYAQKWSPVSRFLGIDLDCIWCFPSDSKFLSGNLHFYNKTKTVFHVNRPASSPNRLPCYVSFICMLTNKYQKYKSEMLMREGNSKSHFYDWTAVWARHQPVFCFDDDYDGDCGDGGMMVICLLPGGFHPTAPNGRDSSREDGSDQRHHQAFQEWDLGDHVR